MGNNIKTSQKYRLIEKNIIAIMWSVRQRKTNVEFKIGNTGILVNISR